jgi:hypothetical protein
MPAKGKSCDQNKCSRMAVLLKKNKKKKIIFGGCK